MTGAPTTPSVLPSPSSPMQVARCFVKMHCLYNDNEDELTLRYLGGSFWSWCGTHWIEINARDIRSQLYDFTEHALYLNDKSELKPWSPNRYKIADLLEALSAIIILPADFEQPGWIDARETGPIVAVANGLLDLKTRQLYPHTPMYFGGISVQFDYDPNAPEPKRWNGFMADLWPDEPDAIDVMGEWLGYVVSGRTDLQKIFAMIGPTRGGKGIIARIEAALIGKRSVCGPTLSSLATDRGLMPMIGKSLAVISDARGSSLKGASGTIVERLLSISGEDVLSIDRKYRDHWSGKLGIRLHIISNELPRLNDASGAIIGRLVLLLTTRSWLGKEDHSLEPDLMKELSGILNFALDGLERLTFENENTFTHYAGADQALAHMRDLASPVGAFVRERCMIEANAEVDTDELYGAFKSWCTAGEFPKSPKTHFGRDLLAAFPSVRKTRPHVGGQRRYIYTGIRLKKEGEEGQDDELPFVKSSGDSVWTDWTGATPPKAGPNGPYENARGADKQATAAAACAKPLRDKQKSDDLPYTGPVVEPPVLGPDAYDEHGAPVTATSGRTEPGTEPGLSRRRIQELADWYQDETHRRYNDNTLKVPALDAELRAILRQEVAFPEHVELEFQRVMDAVFGAV
jgi:putative DNA primase/helicase